MTTHDDTHTVFIDRAHADLLPGDPILAGYVVSNPILGGPYEILKVEEDRNGWHITVRAVPSSSEVAQRLPKFPSKKQFFTGGLVKGGYQPQIPDDRPGETIMPNPPTGGSSVRRTAPNPDTLTVPIVFPTSLGSQTIPSDLVEAALTFGRLARQYGLTKATICGVKLVDD